MTIIDFLRQPWPWYIAGPIIGLSVPALLLIGNKRLGISSSLRHFCAMCFPGNVPFLKYNWKEQIWNIYFVAGLFIGGFVGGILLKSQTPMPLAGSTTKMLRQQGIESVNHLLPVEIFSWANILTWQHLLIVIGGGFLVGFGTRYGGGCTSGHGIYGLSTLQWPSLIAVISFFATGIITSNFILPLLLK